MPFEMYIDAGTPHHSYVLWEHLVISNHRQDCIIQDVLWQVKVVALPVQLQYGREETLQTARMTMTFQKVIRLNSFSIFQKLGCHPTVFL
jgi:hypothetical protein